VSVLTHMNHPVVIKQQKTDQSVNIVVMIAVVFFVISVALENTASRLIPLPATMPTIAGIAIVIAYLLFNPFRRNAGRMDNAFLALLVCALITMVGELFRYIVYGDFPSNSYLETFLMYLKLIIIFYIFNKMIAQSPRLYKLLLYTWVITMCILAIMAIFRIELFTYDYSGRIGIKGENLNIVGHRWAGVAAGMIAYLITKRKFLSKTNIAVIVLIGILTLASFQSGSKGASLALLAGLTVFLLFSAQLKLKTVVKYAALALLFASYLYWTFTKTTVIVDRWSKVGVDNRVTETRTNLFWASLGLIAENPVLGYGSEYDVLLGNRLHRAPIVSHNTITQVLLTSGIVGLIPFALAIGLGVRKSHRYINNPLGGAVFAAWVAFLGSMAFINLAHVKFLWLMFIVVVNYPLLESSTQYLAVQSTLTRAEPQQVSRWHPQGVGSGPFTPER